jgi:hypothetical protein
MTLAVGALIQPPMMKRKLSTATAAALYTLCGMLDMDGQLLVRTS